MKIKTTIFRPEKNAKASVLIIHGMSEHRRRYDSFAMKLRENGYAVLTYDQIGHGESIEETFGYFGTNGWANILKVVCELRENLKKEYPDVPCFLFGHSMGSIVARCMIAHYDDLFEGVILSGAPNYQDAVKYGRILTEVICKVKGDKKTSKLLRSMIEGSFSKAIENRKTDFDWLSFNEENVQEYMTDAFCGQRFTNRGYYDLLTGMMDMADTEHFKKSNLDLPIYFIAGKYDPCTGLEEGFKSSIDTFVNAGYTHVESKTYEHSRHEILNDNDKEEVVNDIVQWLDNQVTDIV